jgi:agmatinase
MTVHSIHPLGMFLAPPPEYCAFDSAAVCILPVPYDATTSYQPGARFGPAALIAASHQVELFDEYVQQETYRIGIHTCAAVPPSASGPEAMVEAVREACEPLLAREKFIALVGGEHSVALGTIAAHLGRRQGRPFGVVQFDAHRDLRATYEDSPASHACVAARIIERGLPLVQIGVRAWCREEQERGNSAGVLAFPAWEVREKDPAVLVDAILEHLPQDVYLTFDLDVLDPSIMPATGTPEPGGLSWYGALDLIERLVAARRVIGLDLVELAPIPGLVAPDLLAARLLYRTIGLIARRWARRDARDD